MRFAPVESADYVICSGLFHEDTETPEDYRAAARADAARARCSWSAAIPMSWSSAASTLLYCAGAIADLYAQAWAARCCMPASPMRRSTIWRCNSPQRARGKKVDQKRVLAIGDSVRTDFTGAASYGIDCLFVTAGIHAAEFGGRDDPDPDAVERVLIAAGGKPRAIAKADVVSCDVVVPALAGTCIQTWLWSRGRRVQLRSTLCAAASSAAAILSAAAWSIGRLRSRSLSASFRFSMPRRIGAGTPS